MIRGIWKKEVGTYFFTPIAPPIALSVFWKRTSGNSVVLATLVSLAIGAPLAWWSNTQLYVYNQPTKVHWVAGVAVGTLLLSTIITVAGSLLEGKKKRGR